MSQAKRCIRCGRDLTVGFVQHFPTTSGGYICIDCVPVRPAQPPHDHTPALSQFLEDYRKTHIRLVNTPIMNSMSSLKRLEPVEQVYELLAKTINASESRQQCRDEIRAMLALEEIKRVLYPDSCSTHEYEQACENIIDECMTVYGRFHPWWRRIGDALGGRRSKI